VGPEEGADVVGISVWLAVVELAVGLGVVGLAEGADVMGDSIGLAVGPAVVGLAVWAGRGGTCRGS